jgi:hypothetical protein
MTLALALAGHAMFTFAARTALASLVACFAITFNSGVNRINNRAPCHGTDKQYCEYENPDPFKHALLLGIYIVNIILIGFLLCNAILARCLT